MFDKSKFKREKTGNQVVFTYEESDAFTKGGDIDVKTLKAVEDYRSKYLKHATEIASELAKETMQKDKKIENVIVEVPFSTNERGGATIKVDRSKTFAVRDYTDGKKTGEVTKSVISVAVKDPYAKVSKKYIKTLAAELTELLVKEND